MNYFPLILTKFYSFTDLKKSLDRFIQEQTKLLFDSDGQSALDRVRTGQVSVDQLVDQWTKAFTQVRQFLFIKKRKILSF